MQARCLGKGNKQHARAHRQVPREAFTYVVVKALLPCAALVRVSLFACLLGSSTFNARASHAWTATIGKYHSPCLHPAQRLGASLSFSVYLGRFNARASHAWRARYISLAMIAPRMHAFARESILGNAYTAGRGVKGARAVPGGEDMGRAVSLVVVLRPTIRMPVRC